MLISQYIHIFILDMGFVKDSADFQTLLLKMEINLLKIIWLYFCIAGNIKTNGIWEDLGVSIHFECL